MGGPQKNCFESHVLPLLIEPGERRERGKKICAIAACEFFCLVTGTTKETMRPTYSLLVIEHPIFVVVAKTKWFRLPIVPTPSSRFHQEHPEFN